MSNYFYLSASLPPINLDGKPEITFLELVDRLEMNLTSDDLREFESFRRYFDIQNIRAKLLGQPIDLRGKLTDMDLDELFLLNIGMPDYVLDFLMRYANTEQRLAHFSSLLSAYYLMEKARPSGFFAKFLSMERGIRLVLLALRCRDLNKSVDDQLLFEDPLDPLVHDILMQKNAPDYQPPAEFKELKELYIKYRKEPLQLRKALALYRYEWVNETVQEPLFSFDWIMGYLIQLWVIEEWQMLNAIEGEKRLERLLA